AGHRGVLIVPLAHGFRHQVDEARIGSEIGKALRQVDRSVFDGQAGHDRKDGRADVRQLARGQRHDRYWYRSKILLMLSAIFRSFSVTMLPASCVVRWMVTRFQTLVHSGWWLLRSARMATSVRKAQAWEKSSNTNSAVSLLSCSVHMSVYSCQFQESSSVAVVCSRSIVARISPMWAISML